MRHALLVMSGLVGTLALFVVFRDPDYLMPGLVDASLAIAALVAGLRSTREPTPARVALIVSGVPAACMTLWHGNAASDSWGLLPFLATALATAVFVIVFPIAWAVARLFVPVVVERHVELVSGSVSSTGVRTPLARVRGRKGRLVAGGILAVATSTTVALVENAWRADDAHDPRTSSARLAMIFAIGGVHERALVVANPSFPMRRLLAVARGEEPRGLHHVVRDAAVASPRIDLETLEHIVMHHGHVDAVRRGACRNPNASTALLTRLVADGVTEDMQWGLASHRMTPRFVLESLAMSKNAELVRRLRERGDLDVDAIRAHPPRAVP